MELVSEFNHTMPTLQRYTVVNAPISGTRYNMIRIEKMYL